MTEPSPLRPCPDRPNCVSTEATDPAKRMAPIPFTGSVEEALARLAVIVGGMPGGTVVNREPDRLRVEFRSRFLGFVDDVDLVIDQDAKLIRFRSASRQGYWDLGVNRRRMERVAQAFSR